MILRHFPTFSKYTWKEWLTLIIAFASIIYALISIIHFASINGDSKHDFFNDPFVKIILITWSCGPPAWFFFEQYMYGRMPIMRKKKDCGLGEI